MNNHRSFPKAARTLAGGLVGVLATTLAVCFLIFLALDVLPGDAATQSLGSAASAGNVDKLRAAEGLDKPVVVRFGSWLVGLLQGDLGTFFSSTAAVGPVFSVALGRSALMVLTALPVVMILGIGLGAWAGLRRESTSDRIISTGAVATIGVPDFIIATILILIFSTLLGWLPAVSLVKAGSTVLDRPQILILPALTLGLMGAAYLFRQTRAAVAQQAQRPHIIAAALSGLSQSRVFFRHLLPGAIGTIGQSLAMTIPALLGGSVVVERVFAYPGIGSMLLNAVIGRDPTPLMACALVLVLPTVIALRLADVGVAQKGEVR